MPNSIKLNDIIIAVAHIISIKQTYNNSVTIEYTGSESGYTEGNISVAQRTFTGIEAVALWEWACSQALDLLDPYVSEEE